MQQPIYFVFLATLLWSTHSQATDQATTRLYDFLSAHEQAAVLLTDANGEHVYAFNEQQPMVPASTVKLLTGLMALEQWGDNFQAETTFFYDLANESLRVVGTGDAFLVSEEIAIIATQLQSKLSTLSADSTSDTGIKHLIVDHSRFKNTSKLSWQGNTSNPYDAVPAALAANFNTLNLSLEGGQAISAEEQTPLTSFSWQKAQERKNDPLSGRINTGTNVSEAARYFGELLAAFLWQQGVSFVDSAGKRHSRSDESSLNPASTRLLLAERVSTTSEHAGIESTPFLYTHRNSKALRTVVKAMLQYSTNFIANNLALMLASESMESPADFTQFNRLAQNFVVQRFGWKNTVLKEGAGLSTANRLSGKQLVELAGAYKIWPELLPAYKPSLFDDSVFAKTGSLSGVSTLAGFITSGSDEDYPFAILLQDRSIINSKARDKVLTLLKEIVDTKR